jgi:hypothetical protein
VLANDTNLEFSAAIWPDIFNFSCKKHVVLAVSAQNLSCVKLVYNLLFSIHLVLANKPSLEFGASV